MLCNLCNYYKTANLKTQNTSKCICELTGFVFHNKPEEYNLEKYPCFDYELKTRKIETVELKETLTANFGKRKPA
jgi:hypothetical protein